MKKVTRAQMNKVAIEINGIMEIDPKIPTKGSATDVQVKKGIKKAVALMEKGDKITESTREVLLNLEFDLSADVEVIKDKKETSSKPAATKKAKVAKPPKDHSKSNKAIIYLAWKDGETDVAKLSKKVKGAIKDSTIKIWVGMWKNKKNLPAVAK